MPAHAAPHIAKQWGPPASPISKAVKAKVVFMFAILKTQAPSLEDLSREINALQRHVRILNSDALQLIVNNQSCQPD